MHLNVYVIGGQSQPLELPDQLTKDVLYATVSRRLDLPLDRLKLVSKGQSLQNEKHIAALASGDTVMALVVPRPPSAAIQALNAGASAEDEEDDVTLRLGDSAPAWQRAVVRWLRARRYPTWPLLLALYPGGKFWACLVAWILGAHVAAALDLGPIYILATLFALMGLNMGRRAAGAPSAYSIFNGLRRLPGQLTAEDLDHQLRHGQM